MSLSQLKKHYLDYFRDHHDSYYIPMDVKSYVDALEEEVKRLESLLKEKNNES